MRRIAILLFAIPAWACSASGHLSPCAYATRDLVFVGKVISGGVPLGENPWHFGGPVQFEVLETLRGQVPGRRFTVEVPNPGGMCLENPFQNGQQYLVSPYRLPETGVWIDSMGEDLRKPQTVHTIARLRAYRGKPPSPLTLGGVIFAQSDRFGRPIPGARIAVTGPGGVRLTAVTNETGGYELTVPTPGHYAARATHAAYPSAIAFSFDLPLTGENVDRNCPLRSDSIRAASSISGHLRDASGKPVKDGHVSLLDPDQQAWNMPNRPAILETVLSGADGAFAFEHVPLGRYVIAWNAEGPGKEGFDGLPFEPTYVPNGATQPCGAAQNGRGSDRATVRCVADSSIVTSTSKAEVITVKSDGMRITNRDLITSQHRPPVTFRKVTVRVRKPNGRTMPGFEVRVWGEPLEPGGPTTLMTRSPHVDGDWNLALGRMLEYLGLLPLEATFEVPANRRVHIEVLDAFGYSLDKRYESWHEPGSSHIVQEFRVPVPY